MSAAPMTISAALDAYMSEYDGKDPALSYRLSTFAAALGADRLLVEVDDDAVFAAIQHLEAQPARFYAGKDADGRPVYKSRGPRSGPTLNRYRQAFAALCSWAIRTRRVPKGWVHPCRGVPARKEHPGRIRFLDDDERARLLTAARASSWPRLYPLVLLAITTGARRGEIERLTWGDVDLQRATAMVKVTKNGSPKVLPLVPAVVELLALLRQDDEKRFAGVARRLVFRSHRRPDQPFNFNPVWHEALKAAKIRDFRFHDLRHSCASYLAQSGASLLEIADLLGHRDLKMTRRYSHLATGSKAALVNRVLGDIR